MKVVWNNFIPFKGYSAINLFGVVFAHKRNKAYYEEMSPEEWSRVLNHEAIHTAQMKELGYIFFYILYILEELFRIVFYPRTAYSGMSFEKEAYKHERNRNYLETRKHFAQWRHP